MDNKKPDEEPKNPLNDGGSLEFDAPEADTTNVISPSSGSESSGGGDAASAKVSDATSSTSKQDLSPKTPRASTNESLLSRFWHKFNIYLLIFVLLFVIVSAVAIVYYFKRNVKTDTPATISQQKLSSDTLNKLASNGVQVGDPKQVLNIQSNAVFAGQVLVKGELQVAGGLKIGGGSLTLPGLTVGGAASINDLQVQSLAIAGNAAVQGQLSVQQNLSVGGNGNFKGGITAGQISTNKLQLVGDLQLTRHIVAGGSIPGRSNGSALGSGGTSSVSGSDTAGSISINTGSGAGAGCFLTINFAQAFSSTPHIVVTPVGSAAGGISYYINRSTSSFSVCTASAPPSNASFGFDYVALD